MVFIRDLFKTREKTKNQKKVIYTVLINDYDEISDPLVVSKDWDYICFTNNQNVQSSIWKVRSIQNELDLDPVRWNRELKIRYYKYLNNYDISIYIDSNVLVRKNLDRFIKKVLKDGVQFSAPVHYLRSCIYDEGGACIRFKKEKEEKIHKQLQRYKLEGYPGKNGLYANRILIRRKADLGMKELMEFWWGEVLNESKRDQISLPYSIWKTNYKSFNSFNYILFQKFMKVNKHVHFR